MKRLLDSAKSPWFRKRAAIWAAVFFVLFTVTGFLVLPPIVKSVLTNKLSEALHREVSIGKVRVNPYVLSVDVSGVTIRERSGQAVFVSFDNLHLNFEAVSIIKGGPVLKEIRLEKPYVNIVRNEDETYNFSDLLEKPKQAPAQKEPSKPLRFSLNNIRINNGSIDFSDGPRNTSHKVREMNIAIPFLSNLSYYVETFVQPSFEAKVNGTPVVFKGISKPFADSHQTSLNVDIQNVDIPYYLAYVPFALDFKVPSAYLDVKAEIAYTQYKDRKPTLALTGNMDLRDVKVTRGSVQQPLISFPRLDVGVASSDLLAPSVHFAKIHLQGPAVSLRRDKAGKLNLPEMPGKEDKGKTTAAEQLKKKEPGPLIEADELLLSDGSVAFEDESVGKTFRTTVSGITMKVAHISTAAEKKAAADLSLKTEVGETLALKGDLSVEPLAADGSLEVKQIKINKYAPYYDKMLLFEIPAGSLDISTGWHVSKKGEDLEMRLSGLSAALSSLRLKRQDSPEDFLNIPGFSVSETEVDLSKKELTIGSLSTQKGMLRARRTRDGKLNLEGLVAAAPASSAREVRKPGKGPAGPEKPWVVALKKMSVEQYGVRFEDDAPSRPAVFTLERITVRGDNISTARNSRGKASLGLTVNKTGTLTVNGTVGIDPLSVNAAVALKHLDLMPLQPYFADKVRIYVTDGHITASGNVAAGYTKDTGVRVSYKGDAALNSFATVDKVNADDLLKWETLHFDGIEASYSPLRLAIKEVALSEFYTRLIINPDGSLNLQGIMEPEAAQSPPPPSAAPVQPAAAAAPPAKQEKAVVKIEKVTVQGGTVNFSDKFIKPNYAANLLEIGGRVTGLSSEETVMADVDLRGKLENYAPLEITGKINPLREDLFVDLKVDFKDMDLSPVTPYSGRYLGYAIHKGKLSLNLKYLIVKKKLDAQNNIFLDQFTLGDRVESPEATKLPVKLAIALLKNRKGEIKLDVPVSGEIDDPKFSLGRIIIKILVNLLVKAATSPFALLGAILGGGGGEELSFAEFDPGSALIPEASVKKLDTLVKALYDRPALKLELEGHVDPDTDTEGLRKYIFEKKLKAQRLKEMIKQGQAAVPVDEVKIEQPDYAKYLKLAYKEEKFPKPRNIIGMAKDLPAPEMEKLMLTHIIVGDDELRQLASRRALAVKEYILKGKQVEPERVFLAEPKSLRPEKKEKARDSRVDFMLK